MGRKIIQINPGSSPRECFEPLARGPHGLCRLAAFCDVPVMALMVSSSRVYLLSLCNALFAAPSGAKTPMAQFVCGWVVGFVLIFLTNFFSRVPKNILGSIIIVSVASLVEYEQAVYLWKVGTA